MRQRTVLAILSYSLFVFFSLSIEWAVAQNKPQAVVESTSSPFELKNGDRVVFLGNSLFENDFQYGYLELALTTRWPDRDVTYRNLGWAGDNVYGVARSTITNPPTAYELLMEHLTKAQPTVVFVAYGGIEAQEGGEADLLFFKEGLSKLLDKIDQLGAKAILLSPMPMLSADSVASGAKRNAMLELYAGTIAKTAAERSKRYIDIFKPLLEIRREGITENGIHLNETGYYHLATILEKGLGLPPRTEPVTITVSKADVAAEAPVKMLNTGTNSADLTFTINERYLPLPLPVDESGHVVSGQIVKIAGLKKGFYRLTANNAEVITASASQWAAGVEIRQGPSFEQVHELRQMILKKNELFFFQYRPLNTTYILGMRAHEQGRHVKGLEEQSIIIKWLEGQIAVHRAPISSVYQLTLLK